MSFKTILAVASAICFGITARAQDEKSIIDLRNALIALSPSTVDPREADLLSTTAHMMSRSLARQYQVDGDPAVHNYLINIGLKKRGICADYTHDIGARLREMRFKTVVLHWGTAYERESDENNALVVTARSQSFYDGIILDGWRRAGRLFWCPVMKDTEYQIEYYTALNQLGSRGHSGITAWKEDLNGTASLQPLPLPSPKPAVKRQAKRRKDR